MYLKIVIAYFILCTKGLHINDCLVNNYFPLLFLKTGNSHYIEKFELNMQKHSVILV